MYSVVILGDTHYDDADPLKGSIAPELPFITVEGNHDVRGNAGAPPDVPAASSSEV